MKFSLVDYAVDVNNSVALLSVYTPVGNLHLGIKPYLDVCIQKGKEVEGYWTWGKASDIADRSLKSFGLGPVALISWMADP